MRRNLPRRRIDFDSLPQEASQFHGRAANRERPGRLGQVDRSADQRRMQGIGDHGQIWQFRHGAAIVAARSRVLDSPGPKRQDS